jgi:hypothetical protein
MRRKVIFSKAYLRFHDQVKALKNGRLGVVKRLAKEAALELENRTRQLDFSLTAYDYR